MGDSPPNPSSDTRDPRDTAGPYDLERGVPDSLALLSLAREGAVGQVWRGYLDFNPTTCGKVVAKLAWLYNLVGEATIYKRLQNVPGVPTFIGLYKCPALAWVTHGIDAGKLMLSDEGHHLKESKSTSQAEL